MDNKPQPGAIPSPFMPDFDMANKMMAEIDIIAKKHGYTQFFVALGKPNTPTSSDWFSQSNSLSDGLVSCLRDSVHAMEKEIDKIKDNGQ